LLIQVDVFGKSQNLELEVYSNPDESLTDYQVDELHSVADSAFDKEGVPEKSDTEDHIVPSDILVAAKLDDEYIGFSSASRAAGTVYEVGIAVDEDFQGNSLGGLILTRGLEGLCEGDELFTYRTQNPAMYGLADSLFDVYPAEDEETPEGVMEGVEDVADFLGVEEVDGHVEKNAYGKDYGSMYESLPRGETREFLESRGMNPDEGDAVIVASEVSDSEVQEAYEEALESFEQEHGVKVGADDR
jgi:hypothetical protein